MSERDSERSVSQTVRAQLALRDMILSGRLRPGERISELQAVDVTGVSRTPVRLALVRLEDEGLVQRQACPEDGRGHMVLITEAGVAVLQRMWPVYGAAIHRLFESKLAGDEIVGLGEVLGKLVDGPGSETA